MNLYMWIENAFASLQDMMEDQDGFGTLELVLLICVLIALALIFKNTIIDFVSNILSNISSQGSSFDPASLAR